MDGAVELVRTGRAGRGERGVLPGIHGDVELAVVGRDGVPGRPVVVHGNGRARTHRLGGERKVLDRDIGAARAALGAAAARAEHEDERESDAHQHCEARERGSGRCSGNHDVDYGYGDEIVQRGSLGSPSTRSPTTLRWISLVPAQIELAW